MNIFKYLDKKYLKEKSEDWDPVGFSFHFNNSVEKVLICLDITKDALDFAILHKIDTILSHHPFIFNPILKDEFSIAPYKKQMIKKIKIHQINIFSLHTNFDAHKKGTAFNIIKLLKLGKVAYEHIDKYNILIHKEITISDLIKKLEGLSLSNFSSNVNLEKALTKKVANFAILPGSGGIEAVITAKKAKAELIITSDLKWNEWITINSFAKKAPIILEISHSIESAFINAISKDLTRNFENLKVYTFYGKELKTVYQNKGTKND